LYEVQYPAPGSPELAQQIQEQLHGESLTPDYDWGLDHGAWSVLCRMFPNADIPVVQLSLDSAKTPAAHYALGQKLNWLRNNGVLILGSGNIVHNLRELKWEESAYDWAVEFDDRIKYAILARNHDIVINYQKLGRAAQLSVPTNEHYLPLLYVLALQQQGEVVGFFAEKVTLGAISMRCVRVG
jgi:4,5-DOPA dioxygenase extradiol